MRPSLSLSIFVLYVVVVVVGKGNKWDGRYCFCDKVEDFYGVFNMCLIGVNFHRSCLK